MASGIARKGEWNETMSTTDDGENYLCDNPYCGQVYTCVEDGYDEGVMVCNVFDLYTSTCPTCGWMNVDDDCEDGFVAARAEHNELTPLSDYTRGFIEKETDIYL